MTRLVLLAVTSLCTTGVVHAQISVSPQEIQLENGTSEGVIVTSASAGQEINAVCYDADVLGVSPESATTSSAKEASFDITCKQGDVADYGTFRRGTTDEQTRIDVNCLNSPFVFINEFSYDDTGTDDREFVELYNRGFVPKDISGWVLEAQDASGFYACYHIPRGTVIPARDYFVMGSANVPNVDLVIGSTDLFQNDNEAITLRRATLAGKSEWRVTSLASGEQTLASLAPPQTWFGYGNVVDTVVYESRLGVWNPGLVEGEGIWGELVSDDAMPTSWSRIWDGRDTKNNGADFAIRPATPGTTNNRPDPPYTAKFDGQGVGSSLSGWGGTKADPTVIDPGAVSAGNPSIIPNSPQGAEAAVFWDPAGGGNTSVHLTQLIGGATIEAWVYLESAPLGGGEIESWSVGFGTTGYDAPLFAGFPRDHAGVAWTYVRSSGGATLYLIDHNDGGVGGGAITPPNTLGSIAITAANDGWQRLRLEVDRCHALGNLGGTFGSLADGTAIRGLISHNFSARGIFASYTETNASSPRPLTMDDVRIDISTSLVHKYGTATATSSGTPSLLTTSPPTVGSSVFGFSISGLVANSPSACLTMGTTRASLPLAGGLPGATQLIGGTLVSTPLTVSGSGTASFTLLTIPGIALGTSCFWQVFDADPLSAPPGLFGHSQGTETRFGY